LLLKHFTKAKALGEWLMSRRALSLHHALSDPRYGIPQGDAESENFVNVMYHQQEPLHFYSSAAEMYRAFNEMGKVWQVVGKAANRDDVTRHGEELLKIAPSLFTDLHASLNKTKYATGTGRVLSTMDSAMLGLALMRATLLDRHADHP
jgi:hypothetical protein